MTYIVPFEGLFFGKVREIYSVNNDNPTKSYSGVTTMGVCPHCKESNIFRVYDERLGYTVDGWHIDAYDCKCPSCRKEFDLEIGYDIDEGEY